MHASIACLLLNEDDVWVSLGNAMKAKQLESTLASKLLFDPESDLEHIFTEQVQEVERQIADLQRELEVREVSRGGFRAVQENERALQRTETIMQQRLANALVRP
jgi:hypothetical protein